MSARLARHVTSTALAAAILLMSAAGATAAPPTCVAPAPETTVENVVWPFFLYAYCQDEDLDPLTFAITDDPDHGTLELTDGDVSYTPGTDYVGPDAFSFTASDGTDETPPVTVAIIVAENQPPVCFEPTYSFAVEPDESVTFYPDCFDDALIVDFPVVDPPSHGTVSGDSFGGLVYEPQPGYVGPDGFTFRASDGELQSEVVKVEISVSHNNAPHCVTPVSRHVAAGGVLSLDHRTTCSDPDGDEISAQLVGGPSHGILDLTNLPAVAYRPNAGYSGPDRIDYRVFDERGAESNVAVLNITVDPKVVKPKPRPDTAAPGLDLARAGGQKLGAVRKKGLKLELTSDEAGTMTIVVSVSKATARKLKIKPKAKGPVVIGRVTRAVSAGENRITVKLTRKARKRLAGRSKVKLSLSVSVVDAAGNTGKDTLQITLRR